MQIDPTAAQGFLVGRTYGRPLSSAAGQQKDEVRLGEGQPGGLMPRQLVKSDSGQPPKVAPSALKAALAFAGRLVGLGGVGLELEGAPAQPPDGPVTLERALQEAVKPPTPFEQALAQVPSFYDGSGRGIDGRRARELLDAGQDVGMFRTTVHGKEEARLMLVIEKLLDPGELTDPALGKGLAQAVQGEYYDKDWQFHAYKALAHYSAAAGNPDLGLSLYERVGEDRRLCLGEFSLDELRAPNFPDRLQERREAAQIVGKAYRDYKAVEAWKLVTEGAEGEPLSQRARLCVAAERNEKLYRGLLALSQHQPPDQVVKWADTVKRVPEKSQALALEHLATVEAEPYLDGLGKVKDPELALRLLELRASHEDGYQLLRHGSIGSDPALYAAWAQAEGRVDVQLYRDQKGPTEFWVKLWTEIPLEDHARFVRFPKATSVKFSHLKEANEAVKAAGPEAVENRMQAWEHWYEALQSHAKDRPVEEATRALQQWPTGPVEPRDVEDLGQMLASPREFRLEAWNEIRQAPSRDLAMALYHAQAEERLPELLEAGRGEPARAAALRQLIQGQIPLGNALKALDFLGDRPERARDYLDLHAQLPPNRYAHRTALAALGQAFEHGPEGGRALVVSLQATGDLGTALGLVPLVTDPGCQEKLAAIALAGRLTAGNPGRVEALARLLLDAGLDQAGLEALEKAATSTTEGSPTQRVEDFLGARAGPEDAPLTRLARGGEMLRLSAPQPELAIAELATRLQSSFGGEGWSAEAEALTALGPTAIPVARDLGTPERLRQALPLLQALVAQQQPESLGRAWTVLTTPVGEESFAERCQAAASFVSAHAQGSLEAVQADWCELVDGQSFGEVTGPGTLLARHAMDEFQPLLELAREQGDFKQGVDSVVAILGRMSGKIAMHGLDVEAVRRELEAPGSEVPMGSVQLQPGSVTVSGVRLRTRS